MKIETRNGLALPLWETFVLENYIGDLKDYHKRGLEIADEIAAIHSPTFKDVIVPFTLHSKRYGPQNMALYHLKSVVSDKYPGIEKIAEEAAMLSSVYGDAIGFHKGLYGAYVKVQSSDEFQTLTSEEKFIIEEAIKDFVLQGINLEKEKQDELKALNERESELTTKFSTNVQLATDAWTLHLLNDSSLEGLSADSISMLENNAKSKGLPGYLITLKPGPYGAILQLANDRELRETLWKAFHARASEIGPNAGEFDNSDIILELISIRNKQAKLLGFNNFSEFSIVDEMAGGVGVAGVDNFFNTLKKHTLPKSAMEIEALSQFAKEELSIDEMMPWDFAFVSHKYKSKYYSIDNEKLREYFPASKVMTGLFNTIERLFGCKIRQADGISTWHPDVKIYEVCDKDDNVFAGFYVDIFERKGKQGGAWMDDVSKRLNIGNIKELPTAYLIANFRNIGGGENYLSHGEITTAFHEAGHVFHHLLTQANYHQTNMLGVEWDAIELPSQLLEEWAWKKDILKSMSAHKETGEQLPDEIFEKLTAAKYYNAGIASGRQVGLGLFDWEIHKLPSITKGGLIELYSLIFLESDASKRHPLQRGPHTFSHIFSGGYSAGYYSYNWANGLVADVYAAFEEDAENELEVATRYKNEILAMGHKRPIIDSFRAFRGRDPKPELLIPFLGLEQNNS